jgi:hypothetical protein
LPLFSSAGKRGRSRRRHQSLGTCGNMHCRDSCCAATSHRQGLRTASDGDMRSLNFTFRCSAIPPGRIRPRRVPPPSAAPAVGPLRFGNHAGFHVGTIVPSKRKSACFGSLGDHRNAVELSGIHEYAEVVRCEETERGLSAARSEGARSFPPGPATTNTHPLCRDQGSARGRWQLRCLE